MGNGGEQIAGGEMVPHLQRICHSVERFGLRPIGSIQRTKHVNILISETNRYMTTSFTHPNTPSVFPIVEDLNGQKKKKVGANREEEAKPAPQPAWPHPSV